MIIVMKPGASKEQVSQICNQIERMGCRPHLSAGEETTIIGVIGDVRLVDRGQIELMDGVERAVRIMRPYKLVGRDFHPKDTLITIGTVVVGGDKVVVMAGPCAVESRDQIIETARAVKEAGATILRGGAFKPRSSPYSFQGMGEEGLKLLAEARDATGLPVVTEIMDQQMVPLVCDYADVLQVGARNMQNFALLQTLGKTNKPILLKRGMMSTIEELLMAAEYIVSSGNPNVMLCERGIRTFEPYTRNTLDINAVPLLKQLCHLPVIVDPSHATGKWELITPVSRASIAAGADGLIIEVHPHPEDALSDGVQSLKFDRFANLMSSIAPVAQAVGRRL